MVKPNHHRRLVLLAALLGVALAGLGYRLVDLQVLRHEELRVQAQRNTERAFVIQPMRGQIRDSRGNLLATSVPARVVCADPTLIGEHQAEVARALAPLLQLDPARLIDRLTPRVRPDGRTNQYVVLKRKVPLDIWEEIRAVMSELSFGLDEDFLTRDQRLFYRSLRTRALFSEEDRLRIYPNDHLAAHVIGFVNMEDQGASGIELTLDAKLRGVPGWRRTETDVRRRELVAYRHQDVEPQDGMNVVLTLDSGIQHIVEMELAEAVGRLEPVSASAVVVRPRTGEILAMATLPNFDPNRPGVFPMDALRNRVISDVAEPGSTFKIVVVSAALNEDIISLDDTFNCENGSWYFGGRRLRDHHPYGLLTVKGIITKSSNIGTAKIGVRMGEARLHQYIRDFGFGVRTGLPLPGEVNGIVHAPKDWSRISIAQIPMGHGIAVTPLQLTMGMAAIANDGALMRPMLVRRLEDPDGRLVAEFQPQMVRRVVSETAARQMNAALQTVVLDGGTAQRARLEHYTVAGKTGTAQKPGPGGYMPGKYYSSFMGFFPAEFPELCVVVVIDEPKNNVYGGLSAAPVFKGIAERSARYLNIKPDITPDTGVRETLAASGR